MGKRGVSGNSWQTTWKGRIFPVSLSNATASQSSTTDLVPGLTRPGTDAAMSGYFTVLFSLLRLHCTHGSQPQRLPSELASARDRLSRMLIQDIHDAAVCQIDRGML